MRSGVLSIGSGWGFGQFVPIIRGVAAYFAGLYNTTLGLYTGVINKLSFSSETISSLASGLWQSVGFTGGVANSGVAGYFVGGQYTTSVFDTFKTTNKIAFPSDTQSYTTGFPGTGSRTQMGSISNSGTAGYLIDGYYDYSASTPILRDMLKLTFSSETYALISTSSLYYYSADLIGMENKGVAGYIEGGQNFANQINKITFSTDAWATLSATISVSGGIWYQASLSNTGVAGYGIGGSPYPSGSITSTQKLSFSAETNSTISSYLTTNFIAGASNNGVTGFVSGGNGSTNAIQKFPYSTETFSAISATLTTGAYGASAMADSGVF